MLKSACFDKYLVSYDDEKIPKALIILQYSYNGLVGDDQGKFI